MDPTGRHGRQETGRRGDAQSASSRFCPGMILSFPIVVVESGQTGDPVHREVERSASPSDENSLI
jgi:hypothetical protein